MDGIDCRKLQEYFNQIPGLIMIDMEGTVFYINDQCARYFQTRKEDFLGKYIKDVFPETKMMENLEIEEPTLVFYNSFLGIGISMHVPLYEDGKKVGLAEYDMVQHSERLYELSDSYKEFLDQELKQLAGELMTFEGTKYTINNLVGTSEPMTELKEKIISTAKTSSTVLITGETGTGKELVAHAIHNLSSRRKERFIKVNASSFPESLIESELFGYERGAFTGAKAEKENLNWRTRELCLLTKLIRCRCPCSQNCCGRFRKKKSTGSAVRGRSLSMYGLLPRPMKTSKTSLKRGSSERIYTTGLM